MGDYELKMAMLKILPSSMRDNMVYRAMDESVPYQRFRDICAHRVAELKYLAGTHKALMATADLPNGAESQRGYEEDDDVLAAEMTKRGWQMVPPSKRKAFLSQRQQPPERP